MTKRIISALLALLMAGSVVLASCAEQADEKDEQTDAATNDIIAEETEEEGEKCNVPTDFNYNGGDFVFLVSSANDDNGADWVTYDIWVEEADADSISDAVYTRNLWLSENYGINIKQVDSGSGTTKSALEKVVRAGTDDYDACIANLAASLQMAQNGNLYNLYDFEYIDLARSWWDQRQLREMSIGGKVYGATGDITIINDDATWTLMFSKALAEANNIPDLYDLVRNKEWNYDKMTEFCTIAANDADGNGRMNYNDTYGFVTHNSSGMGLVLASGETLTAKDEEDYPYFEYNEDRLTGVVEAAGQILSNKDFTWNLSNNSSYDTNDLRKMFEENRSLFFGEVMQCIARMRESENDFGLICWPMYDEQQKEYYNPVHSTAGKCVVVPLTQLEIEECGAIIELFAYKSSTTTKLAYYDVALTYKYMRDEESAEMLDIVRATRCYDLAYIFAWGSLSDSIFSLALTGKNTVASTVAKKEKAFTRALEKSIDKFMENDS